ncbi:hypothetical protein Tco_1218037 [Tanacetum coccineum]
MLVEQRRNIDFIEWEATVRSSFATVLGLLSISFWDMCWFNSSLFQVLPLTSVDMKKQYFVSLSFETPSIHAQDPSCCCRFIKLQSSNPGFSEVFGVKRMQVQLWLGSIGVIFPQFNGQGGGDSVVGDALSRKERVRSRRVRGMILAAKVRHSGKRTYLRKSYMEWNSGDDQLRLRWMIYLVVLEDVAGSVRDTIGFEYCLASSSGWTKSHVLWAEIGESSLTGLGLVQETTDKVVLVIEKPKAAIDRDSLEGRSAFWKEGLRLPKEMNSVHNTFHVSNLKKCLADANLHVPLNEIKVDKTLHFIEEPVEIMDQEIKKLKRRNIALVKVRWNSKRGPEFTWEHEGYEE